MSDDVMERYIRQTISAHRGGPVVTFSWQGGEPTLMGTGFFERVVAYQKKCAGSQIKIENTFQTNGVLLDEQWCRIFT